MADKTKIQWTEATWNPVVGCTKVSPGCKNCYAERMAKRLRAMGKPQYQSVVNNEGWTGKTDFVEGTAFDIPLRWKNPRMVFVGSMCDLFHPSVEIGILTHVFDIIKQCPQHTFQILTKRPEQALKMMWGKHGEGWRYFGDGDYHKNVWLGVTAENQEQADKRIPILLQIPAAVRFVSIEPMLGALDLTDIHEKQGLSTDVITDQKKDVAHFNKVYAKHIKSPLEPEPVLDWVIVGGESGPGARPMHPDWARGVRDQCQAAKTGRSKIDYGKPHCGRRYLELQDSSVPFFFKQWGKHLPYGQISPNYPNTRSDGKLHEFEENSTINPHRSWYFSPVGKKKAGWLLDGKKWNQYPQSGTGG